MKPGEYAWSMTIQWNRNQHGDTKIQTVGGQVTVHPGSTRKDLIDHLYELAKTECKADGTSSILNIYIGEN